MGRATKKMLIILFIGIAHYSSAQDLSKLFEKLSPSVVVINTLTTGPGSNPNSQAGLGSGVLIKEDLVATASHVVHSADAITVMSQGGDEVRAEVLTSIPSLDLAILKLERKPANSSVAQLGNSDKMEIGNEIIVIGAPFGLVHSLSSGHISGRRTKSMVTGGNVEIDFLQTDAAINQGNSGGPMFNMKGEVVGIVSFILSNTGMFNGLGFAASSNMVRNLILENPSLWSGFEGIYLSEESAGIFNVPQSQGILVQRVVKESPADRIGLRAGKHKAIIEGQEVWIGGDIILEIHGTSCNSPQSFELIKKNLNALEVGSSYEIKVLRQGKIVNLAGVITDIPGNKF